MSVLRHGVTFPAILMFHRGEYHSLLCEYEVYKFFMFMFMFMLICIIFTSSLSTEYLWMKHTRLCQEQLVTN